MVCVEVDSPVGSVCEHHILPFFGRIYVCIAQQKDTREARGEGGEGRGEGRGERGGEADDGGVAETVLACVWKFSRQLQLQERLVHQVAEACEGAAPGGAEGVMVVMAAYHHCMRARGAESTAAQTVSVAKRGLFQTDDVASMACLGRFHGEV